MLSLFLYFCIGEGVTLAIRNCGVGMGNSCDNDDDDNIRERRMQPARGRFARFDLDRQIASTFPAH